MINPSAVCADGGHAEDGGVAYGDVDYLVWLGGGVEVQ